MYRSLAEFVRQHGGWPQGVLRLLQRAVSVLVRHGPIAMWRVASTFEARSAERRLAVLRIPGPKGADERPRLGPVPLQVHRADVDIIICVHNALDDVKRCLDSVLRHSGSPYRLILVDDGSESATAEFLQSFSKQHGSRLLRADEPMGYTRAANRGLRASNAEFVILLNSDTIVSEEWLDRLLMCVNSSPSLGLVGPLSNAASWQSVPEVEHEGDWAINTLPKNTQLDVYARWIAKRSPQLYPRVSFLNGFCLLIRRAVLETVGLFDEKTFGKGYGEENDYAIRALAHGWQLAVADDVYVFHAQSRSYSNERRRRLSASAAAALEAKHGQEVIAEGVARTKGSRVMEGLRAHARYLPQREGLIEEGRRRWQGRRVGFVLPVQFGGGGANVVVTEAKAMRRMGIDVSLLNLEGFRSAFETSFPELDLPVAFLSDEREIQRAAQSFDAVVATGWPTVFWLPRRRRARGPTLGYYIQDFEPWFHPEGSPEHARALQSYQHLEGAKLFTKTRWTQQIVSARTGACPSVVGVSADIDLFRPRTSHCFFTEPAQLRVAAMVRPATPRRNAEGTLAVLKMLSQRYDDQVSIVTFGTSPDDPLMRGLDLDFPHRNLGVLRSHDLSLLFNEVDLFLDLSRFQAMGLTAMEAMACGAAVLLPRNGGCSDYARPDENAIFVDTTSARAVLKQAERVLDEPTLRFRLAHNAMREMPKFHPEGSAFRILKELFA